VKASAAVYNRGDALDFLTGKIIFNFHKNIYIPEIGVNWNIRSKADIKC